MDSIAIVHLAISDPMQGIPMLLEQLTELNSVGDAEGAHVVQDAIVVVCSEHQLYLERAEELAIDLLDRIPDQTHALMLAKIYMLTGRTADAASLEIRARAMSDVHDRTRARSALAQIIAQDKIPKR